MTTTQLLGDDRPLIESAPATAIRSHQSYEPLVEGVCHHSGRYLTRAEINPQRIGLLREHHDFPGHAALDELFHPAVHAREHQHLIWNRYGLQGIALIATGVLLLLLLPQVLRRADHYVGLTEFIIVYTVLAVAGIVAVGAIVWGTRRVQRRTAIYHKQARGVARPAMIDYPLLCSYKVMLHEDIQADLRNDAPTTPTVKAARGSLTVEARPEPLCVTHYESYRETYKQPGVGAYVHAGLVALERLEPITFAPAIEYQHRLPLRQDAAVFAQSIATHEPLRFGAQYTISPAVLYTPNQQHGQFVLELRPELQAYDSRTLVLRFRWLGDKRIPVKLITCRITLPPELADVDRVEQGRRIEQDGRTDVLWSNLLFQEGELVLSIVCRTPIVEHSQSITGSYQVAVEGALSGIQARPENIWNAMGRRATERTQPQIHYYSIIHGALTVNTGLLAQEHEFACTPDIIEFDDPPDHIVIKKIAKVLTDGQVNIRRIEQATPRLDPAGSLKMQLRYWDIAGRLYEMSMLEPMEVHVVVSGRRPLGTEPELSAHTRIDVRVRGLHEPRAQAGQQEPRTSAVQQKASDIHTSLVREIRRAFDLPIGHESTTQG